MGRLKAIITGNVALLRRNGRIMENFFSMTLISFLNTAFSLVLYPLLIRRLGAESYGSFVFAFSFVNYFLALVAFGYDTVGAKYVAVADGNNDKRLKSEVLSAILAGKGLIALAGAALYMGLVLAIPLFREHLALYAALALMIPINVISTAWYYQAIQKNRVNLIIQFTAKVLLLVGVVMFVTGKEDVAVYALCASVTTFLAMLGSLLYVLRKERIALKRVSLGTLRLYTREATPLFFSNMVNTIKIMGMNNAIGILLGMRELAAFDLAYKVMTAANIAIRSLHAALFPNLVQRFSLDRAKRILRKELIVGVTGMIALMLCSGWIVRLFAGKELVPVAQPILIILASLLVVWMFSGFLIDLVLIPTGRYRTVFINQLVSLASLAAIGYIAVSIHRSAASVALALVLAGVVELVFLLLQIFYVHRKSAAKPN